MRTNLISLALAAAVVAGTAHDATAVPATLVANQVIIDNSPFYSVGGEDNLGSGNYGLNFPNFIDIPYAIFDFGGATSVTTAVLQWNFLSLFGGSGPAQITLYAGSDVSGAIETSDRFMGTAIDTFTYSGGEARSFDVTAAVNAALASGHDLAVRLEATTAPGSLVSYYGGQFDVPSVEYRPGGAPDVPAPASIALFALGLAGLMAARKRMPA